TGDRSVATVAGINSGSSLGAGVSGSNSSNVELLSGAVGPSASGVKPNSSGETRCNCGFACTVAGSGAGAPNGVAGTVPLVDGAWAVCDDRRESALGGSATDGALGTSPPCVISPGD